MPEKTPNNKLEEVRSVTGMVVVEVNIQPEWVLLLDHLQAHLLGSWDLNTKIYARLTVRILSLFWGLGIVLAVNIETAFPKPSELRACCRSN